MEKILVEIYIPSANRSLDMKIPKYIELYKIISNLSVAVEQITDGAYQAREDSILCDYSTENILNINLSAKELKIRNGWKLILI